MPPSNDRQSVQLLSRIFSLISLDSVGVDLTRKEVVIKQIDFDISQFCTFMERLKFTWRTTFQVILYRAFKSGKASIVNAQKLIQKLSFKKQQSSGLTGLVIKSILCRNSLNKDPSSPHNFFRTTSLFEEFEFLSSKEISKILEHGAELWMILKKINNTACNRSE